MEINTILLTIALILLVVSGYIIFVLLPRK